MKVAMIGQKGLPASFGGIERHCEELGSRLSSLGCDVTVFCRPYYSAREIEKRSLEQIDDHSYRYKGMTLKVLPTIPTKHLDAATHSLVCTLSSLFHQYDLLHYHALGPTLFSRIPRLFKRRIVSTVHGLDWQRGKWGDFAKWVLQKGEQNCALHTDALIVVSRTLQDYFEKNYSVRPTYIPNGINRPRRLPARNISARWRLERDSYILFVGRFVPEKGCHYLIEAFKGLKTDKSLVIAGGESHSREYAKKLYKMSYGGSRILFTGYVYDDVLDELFSNAYLYVHPSDMEGLPLSLLEALSYGNCVLASDIPENAEVIAPEGTEEYGFMFPRGNVEMLRSKLEKLLAHPMLVKETAARVVEYVLKTYDWDRIAEETLEVYQKVAGKE